MRLLHFGLGVVLGGLLFVLGGLVWVPPAPACVGCAVLVPSVSCGTMTSQNVVGGHICGP